MKTSDIILSIIAFGSSLPFVLCTKSQIKSPTENSTVSAPGMLTDFAKKEQSCRTTLISRQKPMPLSPYE
jgi:hypothetical protein